MKRRGQRRPAGIGGSSVCTISHLFFSSNWRNCLAGSAVVSYTWSVTPTPVQDKYVFTLEATFETYVPMPVVTVEVLGSVFFFKKKKKRGRRRRREKKKREEEEEEEEKHGEKRET